MGNPTMRKLIFLAAFFTTGFCYGEQYKTIFNGFTSRPDFVTVVSTASLSGDFILNQQTPQSNAAFNVSSGSVSGGITVGSITVSGTGAGQISLTEGSSTTVTGVGTGVDVIWADTDLHRLMMNTNNISTQTIMGNPGIETWVNSTGGIYISSWTSVNISTVTYQSVYLNIAGGGLSIPEATLAEIGAATPGLSGWGNIVKCTNCVATVNVCTSTGTTKGSWALITATGSACQ